MPNLIEKVFQIDRKSPDELASLVEDRVLMSGKCLEDKIPVIAAQSEAIIANATITAFMRGDRKVIEQIRKILTNS